ncbi:hypothetical protein M0G74_16605 [Microbulbifer sp. CAU 1566]|uniref:hypothetical protein n=1 Tax=Microbulbifer sp. CAU 1566 TaxID=2933269 RepID=UPI002006D18D|nr:hypothetical protein [Microbulbifer sp. CAU 1566]MCK7598896.1 hypothetical protein [Microbulbifer sp. CAU 1566]
MRTKISSEQLQQALRALPAPDPGEEFESRLMARVFTHRDHARIASQKVTGNRLRLSAAMAASLLLGLWLAPLLTSSDHKSEVVAGVGTAGVRPLTVRLDSPVALNGAIIRVQLPAHARIQGYADVQLLEWQTDIAAGANQITLPLTLDPAFERKTAGQLTVEVEYRGARKTLRYAVPPTNQTMTQL